MANNEQRHERSARLIERAKEVTPGGIHSSSRNQMMEDRDGNPVCFERTAGAELFDMEGNRYIDYQNAWGPIILGHCDEDVNRAVREATDERDIVGMSTSELEVKAAEMVKERVPCADKVQFGTTGSEVVAHAIRLARAETGRDKILKFQANYHGWYDPVALNHLSDPDKLDEHDPFTMGLLPSSYENTVVVPYNDIKAVREAFQEHEGDIAGVILEPVAHNAGCIPPVDGFLEGLREITDEHGSLLIFDEIVTGFRHGIGGVQEREGITPDVCTMAKAVANGYQVSLMAGKDEYMQEFAVGDRGGSVYFAGTYNSHTAGMAAVVETITQLEERNVYDRLESIRKRLANAMKDHLEDTGVQGVVQEYGTIFGTYFGEGPIEEYRDVLDLDQERFLEFRWEMVDRGVFMVPRFPRANLLNASLTDDHVEETIEAAGEAMRAVAD